MSKKVITILAVVAAVAALGFWCAGKYNSLVQAEESVNSKWAFVESAYQRRADLIPNLVQVVKGYASHENETLVAVVEARAKATSVTVNPEDLTEESMARFQSAQSELSNALGRLMVLHEAYPELKADAMFRDLQVQLEGTENRINTERNNFNESAKEYNTLLRTFPNNIIAGIFGFKTKAYFKAEESAAQAPKVSFE